MTYNVFWWDVKPCSVYLPHLCGLAHLCVCGSAHLCGLAHLCVCVVQLTCVVQHTVVASRQRVVGVWSAVRL